MPPLTVLQLYTLWQAQLCGTSAGVFMVCCHGK